MHASSRDRPHRNRRVGRRLIQIVWALAVAQILLIVVDPGGLRQRLGPAPLAISLFTLFVLAAAARRITHRPKPESLADGGLGAPVAAELTATAVGGPCDGASWQLGPNHLLAPKQVWLPAGDGSHCYRLTGTPTPGMTLTYTHHPPAPGTGPG